ncbi:MAG: hypothetical protein ACK5LR_00475, partial [Mangrovibacterium sp.]
MAEVLHQKFPNDCNKEISIKTVFNTILFMEKNESKMRGAIKAIYNMPAFNWVLSPLKACYDFYRYRMISDRQFIRKRYKKILGRYPDLDNPQLFTE